MMTPQGEALRSVFPDAPAVTDLSRPALFSLQLRPHCLGSGEKLFLHAGKGWVSPWSLPCFESRLEKDVSWFFIPRV